MLHTLVAAVACLVPPSVVDVLAPAVPVERAIAAGETQAFSLELTEHQFVALHVAEQDVDVVITVLTPDGALVRRVDDLDGHGVEIVTFPAADAGAYTVRVEGLPGPAAPGRFTIEAVRVEDEAAEASARVGQIMARWDTLDRPGAAVAVVQGGDVVHASGHGSAQLEYGIPITPDTVFHIASVSKQFTAFAIALLADRGALALDDDVRTHIPELPDFGHTITLRHLTHHTSGLRDQWNLLGLAGWRLDDVITREHILSMMVHQRDLNFEPGARHVYCNTGYTLLAEVVARISGQSFTDWTKANIFGPLGMTATHFHDDHEHIVPNRAYSYKRKDGRWANSVLSYANVGATSLFTTVNDLAKWSNNFDTHDVGGRDVIKQMYEPCILNDGRTVPYGFGLSFGSFRGVRHEGHAGGDAGFRSYLVRFPSEELAVIVLSNDGGFDAQAVALRIAEAYLGDALEALPEADADQSKPNAAPDAEPAFTLDPATLDDYDGLYVLDIGMRLNIGRDGDRLMGWVTMQDRFPLQPVARDAFRVAAAGADVRFVRDDDDRVVRVRVNQAGRIAEGERGERVELSHEQMQAYVGRYDSDELGTFYEIVIVDDHLVARHRRTGDVQLSFDADDVFNGGDWYFGRTRFERDDTAAVVAMYVSNGRVREVKFVRGGE